MRRYSPELWLAALLVLGYAFLRATWLSMTHDEASTWAHALDYKNLWECFRSPHCWDSANLHWLNTWLMKRVMETIGQAEWVLRLPNVLALGIYLVALIRLLRRHTDRLWLRWAGFGLLVLHPFLLEFFSLARGYGLACGLLLWSWERWEAYQINPTLGKALGVWLVAALGVLANFTLLPFYCALLGLSALTGLINWRTKGEMNLQTFTLFLVGVAVSLGLGLLIGYPLYLLSQGIEFTYGATSLFDTFYSLIVHGMQGRGYLGEDTSLIFAWIIMPLTVGALVAGLTHSRRLAEKLRAAFPAIAWLFLGMCLILVLQYYLLGTHYLLSRTALSFIPVWGYLLWQGLLAWQTWQPRLGVITAAMVTAMALWHFGGTANFYNCRQWYYDAKTKALAEYLEEKIPVDQRISLGAHWLFVPSLRYYLSTGTLPQAKEAWLPYHRDLRLDAGYDYYYVTPNDLETLKPQYQPIQHFGAVGVLCRRVDGG